MLTLTLCLLDVSVIYILNILGGLRMLPYTRCSLYVLGYGMLVETLCRDRSIIIPYSLINFAAINITFNSSYLLDNTSFDRFADKYGMTLLGFHRFNISVHLIPFVFVAYRYYAHKHLYNKLFTSTCISPLKVAVFSSILHIQWAFISCKGLDLCNMYIHMTYNQWLILWILGTLTNISMGKLLSPSVRHNATPKNILQT